MGRDSRLRRERRIRNGGLPPTTSRATRATRIKCDFFNDLRNHAAAELKAVARSTVDPNLSVREVVYAWANYRHHRIEACPRKVHWSHELRSSNLDQKLSEGIQRIEATALAGGDLNPFQTTLLVNFNRKDKKGNDWKEGVKHRDGMLLDWGITHMHLGPPQTSQPFVKRTGQLLFVMVQRDDLYLLAVEDHHSFTRDALLEIVHKNWSHLLDVYRAPASVVGFEDAFSGGLSDQERREMRESMTLPVQMSDGTMYFAPGGGVTSMGSSATAIDQANTLLRTVKLMEDQVRANKMAIAEFMKPTMGTPPEITLEYEHQNQAIREKASGVELPLEIIGLKRR